MSTDTATVSGMSKEHGSRVAANIRGELGRAGYRQTDLAEALSMPHSGVSDRLSGKTQITVDWLFDVAAFLKVDAVKLIDQT
jgi:transcriptional regulator with XRE-family HTH domain